jgi:membrane-bound lytic murein transglycosylase F
LRRRWSGGVASGVRPLITVICVTITLITVTATRAVAQTERYDDAFRKYSKRYFGPLFDWRLFKAQAMAESNLQTTARSWAGARGIMQLMPTTFREIRSKNPEINGRWDRPEWNIAAGIAYSRQLWEAWTNDAVVEHLREFMLASYNAGRVTLLRAQQVARTQSLDPTLWPSIEAVAPSVPKWRYDETLSYLGRILANLSRMDARGNVVEQQ